MGGRIFISYRRDDSADRVHGIAQYLERRFGRGNVFLDVDMHAGTNFRRELERRLTECSVLLAVIGPEWLIARQTGASRLESPDDWVHIEISTALGRSIPVIPVLVGGAELPRPDQLPDELRGLLDHQAAVVDTRTFRNDMAGLVRDIAIFRTAMWGRRHLILWAVAIATVAAVVAASWIAGLVDIGRR